MVHWTPSTITTQQWQGCVCVCVCVQLERAGAQHLSANIYNTFTRTVKPRQIRTDHLNLMETKYIYIYTHTHTEAWTGVLSEGTMLLQFSCGLEPKPKVSLVYCRFKVSLQHSYLGHRSLCRGILHTAAHQSQAFPLTSGSWWGVSIFFLVQED